MTPQLKPCSIGCTEIAFYSSSFSSGLSRSTASARESRGRAVGGTSSHERGNAYSAFTSSNSTTLFSPVIGTMTPGDFTINLSPSTRMK